MRILHLVGHLNYGGIERMVTDLAIAQKKAGYNPAVCCLLRREGNFIQILEREGILVFNASHPDKEPWKLFFRLGGQRKSWEPDIVHSHVNFSLIWQVFAFWKWKRIPFILTQHTLLSPTLGVQIRSPLIYRIIKPFIGKHIAVSNYSAHYAARLYRIKPDRIKVIYNGIIPGRYKFNHQDRERLRKEWGLPEDAILWGSTGRLDWVKGYDLFLKSFAEAKKKMPNLYFAVAGDGPLKRDLQNLTSSLRCQHSVLWLGRIEHVSSALSAYDIYTQPSRWESLSLAILEGLANGLKVVANNIGGVKEIAQYNNAVRLIPLENEVVLTETITEESQQINLQNDRGSKLSKIFSFDTMAKDYESCYLRMLNCE
jgi:glycosyltransferase involved in cell wall biosynthesis